MAEFLWTFAVQEVLKKVLKVAAQQIGVAWEFKKELSELTQWLTDSETILRGINTKNETVRVWVDHLQHLVYEADDLFDEIVYEDLRQKVETGRKKKVRNFCSSSNNPILFRLKMAKRMNDISKALKTHYSKASSFVVASVVERSTETHMNIDLKQIRETISTLNFGEVPIGREVEVSKIVKLVIDSNNQYPMSIVSIVGMGGLGKTTLAKMVFNHELVKGHFDKFIWVCVSEPFIIMNILEGIYQSLTKTSCNGLNKENLLQKLKQEMQGKNYFLVLDDVWNENARLWSELRDCLKNITPKLGNSILVTTRSAEVATIMETTSSHHLEKLSHGQCWSLFKESANACDLELEDIREEVVRKIGGIPLVAKVLGGAVKFEGDYEGWMTKFKSVVKNISKDDKDFVSSTLKLSVDCLPLPSLKQCFAYCSNFPKDHIFYKHHLIQMWIAQGFIQPQGEDNELLMEDIGEGYFNFLLSRSLFEVLKEDKSESQFKMHDLIHDIACAISGHQKVESKLSNYGKKGMRKLRTLIYFDKEIMNDKSIEDYVSLRVLKVNEKCMEIFNSFSMFKHMRYLEVRVRSFTNKLKTSFESISMLYNLETLKFGVEVTTLPKKIRNLVKLRHFIVWNFWVEDMPLCMSRLIHLQTLPIFRVGHEEGRTIEELGPLKNLKGSLKLCNLNKVKSKEEAINAKLMEKSKLTNLEFWWNASLLRDYNKQSEFKVLEGLQPHHNLQSLYIKCYNGQAFPQSIFVEGLVKITLYGCKKCEKLPMLGQLPCLEKLFIHGLESVRNIGREFYGLDNSNQMVSFPKLKEFTLWHMINLQNWEDVPNGIAFPLLVTLEIQHCTKLMSIPSHFVSLQTLRIYYCTEMTKLPNQFECCSSIKTLSISYCPKLSQNICNQNLEYISIGACMRHYNFSFFMHNSSITKLVLHDIPKDHPTIELPQQLEYLTNLKILRIEYFHGIEVLQDWPLEKLISLETLEIFRCDNLKGLPSKQVILSLTKLKYLEVCDCGWFKELGEEERDKFSHLPNITIKILFNHVRSER